jgi:hypothetical protein
VKVEPTDILKFARSDSTFRLHTASGKFHAEIDANALRQLAERGWIVSYAKGGRLTWVQLQVPPYVADRVLFADGGGRRRPPKNAFHSEASDTTVKQRSESTHQESYRHHGERCSLWRSYGSAASANSRKGSSPRG